MAYGLETYNGDSTLNIGGDDAIVRVISEHTLAIDTTSSQSIAVPEGDFTFFLMKPSAAGTPPHRVTLTRTSPSAATLAWAEPLNNDWSTWGPTIVTVIAYA